MPRQRKNQKAKAAKVASDDEIEEIPRKTLLDQIGANFPNVENGVPFDLKQLQNPLSEALAKDTKGGKITYESYNIPTALPDRKRSKKTKIDEIVEDKDAEEEEDGEDNYVIGDVGQTFFFSIPLTMMLFAFHILVQKQYLEELGYMYAFKRSAGSFPAIWFILYLTHPRRNSRAMQVLFVIVAVISGCWMVYNVNFHGYYAIMKMVPPLGTMLIYAVAQMDIIPSVATLALIGCYVWYKDLKIMS